MSNSIDTAKFLKDLEALGQAVDRAGLAYGSVPPALPSPPSVKGLWYNEKVIKLDGWRFEACRFDKCRLIIETPNFSLVDCYLDESNFIEVAGKLVNALQFANLRGECSDSPSYYPVRNPNGTVSVGD
ncbi:hypothetical protein [Pseudomonas sp.]|uniref:hypothetical protein n=1 Tax=Pseudomonas sp. TaxID=306 RepID=UPI0023557CDC|nr:hypothetical protein [Pseudomonas sp.]